MTARDAIIASLLFLICNALIPLALSLSLEKCSRCQIASEEEAIDVRRRLLSVNPDSIPDSREETLVTLDPVMGPWPQCVGMQADDCISIIESMAADIYTVVVLPREPERTRVRVKVDSAGKVIQAPERG